MQLNQQVFLTVALPVSKYTCDAYELKQDYERKMNDYYSREQFHEILVNAGFIPNRKGLFKFKRIVL